MALTFVETPNPAVIHPSQGNCGSLCFKLQSDIYLTSTGVDAVISFQFTGLPNDGESIVIDGLKVTFRSGSALPGEIQITTVAALSAVTAEYFVDNLENYDYTSDSGGNFSLIKRAIFLRPGEDLNIPYDLRGVTISGNLVNTADTAGTPYQPIPNYAVDFRVRQRKGLSDYKNLFTGRAVPKVTKDFQTLTLSHEINIDISNIPSLGDLTSLPSGSIEQDLGRVIEVQFAERIGASRSTWSLPFVFSVLHSSADCNRVDMSELIPQTGFSKFLYIPGSDDARVLCSGDKVVLYGMASTGEYTPQINDSDPNGLYTTVNVVEQISGFSYDFTPYIGGQSGEFFLSMEADNTHSVGPLSFTRKTQSTAECCNQSQIMFLNNLGGWQWFGITKLRSAGIVIEASQYVNCSTCGGASKARIAAKSSIMTETYYTRPLRVTEANVALLEAFLGAAHYRDVDGNAIELVIEDYAIETPNRRIQIPITFQRLEKDYALIDSTLNSQ